jgi:N4-gp56 family major capsid protein
MKRLFSTLALAIAFIAFLMPGTAPCAAQAGPDAMQAGLSLGAGSLGDWLAGLAFTAPLALGSVANFIPAVWSQNLNRQLRKARNMAALTNADYEGDISDRGDTVKITRPSSISIKDYDGSVTYDDPSSTQQTLTITEARYFAFGIDDVDAVQANSDLVSNFTEEAGESMADDDDEYIAGHYTDVHADNVIAKDNITESNVYEKLVEAGKRLDAKNVPSSGRVAALSAEMLSLLRKADEFIKASDLGDEVVQTGAIGMAAGFSIFLSNSVQVANDGTDDVEHNVLGTDAAITFADQFVQMEAMRLENQFGDGIRGLHVYGSQTVRPEALVDLRRIA